MTHLWAFMRCNSADAAAPFPFSLSTANAIVTVVAAAVVVVVVVAAVGAVVLLLLIVVIAAAVAVVVVIAVVVAVVVVVQPFVLVIIVTFVVLVVVAAAAAAVVRIEVERAFTFCQQDCVFFCDVTVASCVIFVSKRVFAAGHNWGGKLPSPSARF